MTSKDKYTSVNANDLEQDNAEDSDFDGEVSLNETMGLKVFMNKLLRIHSFGKDLNFQKTALINEN